MDPRKGAMETKVVHGGQTVDQFTGAVAPPIYQTSTFAFKSADQGARLFTGEEEGYIYTRLSNPTIDILERKLAVLENTEAGIAFGSGLAAIFGCIITLAKSGDHVVSDDTLYGGTYAQFVEILPRVGIEVTFVDATDLDQVRDAIGERTRLIFFETPANPTLKVIDIEGVAGIAHERGALLMVDNTFATPCIQRPMEHGADLVVHSTTKYIGGHGDAVGGISVGPREIIDRVRGEIAGESGGIMSPFNAWLNLRGLKTLALRMERHSYNGLKVAQFLAQHPQVEKVYYPGLSDHPQHDLARRQMSAFGGMVAFDVVGGRDVGRALMDSVELCILAVSLGDCDTLIEHPASMTHCSYSTEECLKVGINPGFVRLSVGIEHEDDIITDLDQALARATRSS